MHELEIAVYQRIAYCIDKFNKGIDAHEVEPFESVPTVKFDLKGHCAGQAFYHTNKLRFNNDLLLRYKHQFITETVDHEMAHLFAHHIRPECSAHGFTWRWCMFRLGYKKAERCHSMKTASARKVAKFAYTCLCGDVHRVGTKKHKKIQNGAKYRCTTCDTRLALTE